MQECVPCFYSLLINIIAICTAGIILRCSAKCRLAVVLSSLLIAVAELIVFLLILVLLILERLKIRVLLVLSALSVCVGRIVIRHFKHSLNQKYCRQTSVKICFPAQNKIF